MFYVGQNVCCAESFSNTSECGFKTLPSVPQRGGVYTVAGARPDKCGRRTMLVLEEFPSNCAFNSRHFRPLQDISEDIMNQLRAPLNERSKEVA